MHKANYQQSSTDKIIQGFPVTMEHMKFYESEVCTKVNVPFSWEVKPGVCKLSTDIQSSGALLSHFTLQLSPPPSSFSPRNYMGDIGLQNVPRNQPATRGSSSFRMGMEKAEDPFLAAFMRCTRSSSMHNLSGKNEKDVGFGKRKSILRGTLSCKYSCPIIEDNLVRISRFPKSTERE